MRTTVPNKKRRKQSWQIPPISAIGGLFALSYAVLVVRCGYFQLRHGSEIRKEADESKIGPLSSIGIRGSILDRDGKVLASSTYIGELGFDPYPFNHYETNKIHERNEAALTHSIEFLAPMLGVSTDDLTKEINDIKADSLRQEDIVLAKLKAAGKPTDKIKVKRFYSIKDHLSLDECRVIKGRTSPDFAQKPKLGLYRVIGFTVKDKTERTPSDGPAFSQVVGFVGKNDNPQAGIERACNNYLAGTESKGKADLDRKRRPFPETIKWDVVGHDGDNVTTALDPFIQNLALEQAKNIMDLYKAKGVSIIVENPASGDLLAMVSTPTFDPSPAARKDLHLVVSKEGDDRLGERCATLLYEPGSTLKGLTVAAALDQGVINMNSHFPCSGSIRYGRKLIHCPVYGPWDAHGHGSVDANSLLEHSCNVAAAQVGVLMGAARLKKGDTDFGLFDKLDIDLPLPQHGRWSMDVNEDKNSIAKIARVAFGHSIAVTPAHVVRAYSAIANGGLLMQQRLVTQITDAQGNVVVDHKPSVIRRVISEQTSQLVTGMLTNVVTKGTGKTAAVKGYWVAGKTGTAKKYVPGKYASSFIGYLPASPTVKPRAVIMIVVDEPGPGPHYGATVAAPAFHAIAAALMDYWKVPQDDPQSVQYNTAKSGLKNDHDAPRAASQRAL